MFFWLGGGGGGAGADFFQQFNKIFFIDKVKVSFRNTIVYNTLLYTCLTSVSSNKYISDQHS